MHTRHFTPNHRHRVGAKTPRRDVRTPKNAVLAAVAAVIAVVLGMVVAPSTAVAQPAAAANDGNLALHRLDVPSPLMTADSQRLAQTLRELPADASAMLVFTGGAGDVEASARLADAVFADRQRIHVAVVAGPISGPLLMAVLACEEIWMQPTSRLGPLGRQAVRDPNWGAESAAFRSQLRSVGDARQSRIAIWEKWLDPNLPLLHLPTQPIPFANERPSALPADVVVSTVQGPGELVLVAADAQRISLAALATGDANLAAFAASKGFRLIEPDRAETVSPPPTRPADPSAVPSAPIAEPVPKRPTLPTTPQRGAIIPITDTVDGGLAAHVQRRTEEALEAGATVIVYEFDTPGGSVKAMGDIRNVIADVRGKAITVAWVERDAISAGALIALACDFIAMRDGAQMGDCQPILAGAEGYTVGGEKIQTYLRALVESDAERAGYPRALAVAMITQEIEVIEVRPFAERDAALLAQKFDSTFVIRREFEAWPERDRFEIVRIVVHGADPTHRVAGDEAKTMGQSIAAGELLTMTASQARDFGFAMPSVTTVEQLYATFRIGETHGLAPVERLGITWSVELVRFIQSIAGLLVIVGLLGLYIEFQTPGFGLGGIVALVAFGLYFFSSTFVGLADSIEVIIFLVGLALIAVEIFVLPGFGVAGILGLICVFSGLLLAGQTFVIPETPAQIDIFTRNFVGLMLSFIGAVIGMVLISKFLPKVPFLNRIILLPEKSDLPDAKHAAVGIKTGHLLGAIGDTVTDLRPGGKAKFGAEIVDVVAVGGFIDTGARIVVTEAQGNRILVKPLPAETHV